MKLYEDYYKTATILIPELRQLNLIVNGEYFIESKYYHIKTKVDLVNYEEPTALFTFYIPDLISNYTDEFISRVNFTFDCFINNIYLKFGYCKINCVNNNVFEVSASKIVIEGTSSLEDLFNILTDE